jgi:hypothetical protein
VSVASITVPSTAAEPLRVLQLGSTKPGVHTNTDRFLDPSWAEVTTMLVEYWPADRPLPHADLVFNAIADADGCADALDVAAAIAARIDAPLVNAPQLVKRTGRSDAPLLFAGIPGLRVPSNAKIARSELMSHGADAIADAGLTFPVLLRSLGFHNGANFVMVKSAQELQQSVAALPGDPLLAIEFVDVRDDDGFVRKFRAIVVGGKLYPAHLAIGNMWKLHYFSATMGDRQRDDEASYLDDMRAYLGPWNYDALAEVARRMQLEYAGMDFGLDRNGTPVLFEANASMTVFLPNPAPETEYRRQAATSINNAARQLMIALSSRA